MSCKVEMLGVQELIVLQCSAASIDHIFHTCIIMLRLVFFAEGVSQRARITTTHDVTHWFLY